MKMVFKFTRIDSTSPNKVALPIGKHIVGRGKFLLSNTDDPKVSRNHAELEVREDSVTVKSLHVNPCFYIKHNTETKQILTENSMIELSNGDKLGILPETFWYELIYVQDENIEDSEGVENNIVIIQTDTVINEIKEENVSINHEEDELTSNGDSQSSPSLLRNSSPTQDYTLDSTKLNPREDQDSCKSPGKRSHDSQTEESSTSGDSKRVKIEPETVKPENSVTNDPGPSNNQVATSDAQANRQSQPPSVAGQPNKQQLREKCMYGANCYRKNIQHKADFSHPNDPDWDDSQRQCQFGANCIRRNPRHWQDCIHPPGVNPPNPNRPGMRVVERHGNIFYINADTVNFYDDRFEVVDSEGDSVDYDYEF